MILLCEPRKEPLRRAGGQRGAFKWIPRSCWRQLLKASKQLCAAVPPRARGVTGVQRVRQAGARRSKRGALVKKILQAVGWSRREAYKRTPHKTWMQNTPFPLHEAHTLWGKPPHVREGEETGVPEALPHVGDTWKVSGVKGTDLVLVRALRCPRDERWLVECHALENPALDGELQQLLSRISPALCPKSPVATLNRVVSYDLCYLHPDCFTAEVAAEYVQLDNMREPPLPNSMLHVDYLPSIKSAKEPAAALQYGVSIFVLYLRVPHLPADQQLILLSDVLRETPGTEVHGLSVDEHTFFLNAGGTFYSGNVTDVGGDDYKNAVAGRSDDNTFEFTWSVQRERKKLRRRSTKQPQPDNSPILVPQMPQLQRIPNATSPLHYGACLRCVQLGRDMCECLS